MSEKLKNPTNIREIIEQRRPQLADFDSASAQKDWQRIASYKNSKNIIDSRRELPPAAVLEYTIYDQIYRNDWLGNYAGEDETTGEEQFGLLSFLPSEFDDYANHTDIICFADNKFTKDQPVPFALDVTFNTDTEGLSNKFAWPRHGTKVLGVATEKYFTNKDPRHAEQDLGLSNDSIPTLPRFVVGVNDDLAADVVRFSSKIDRGARLTGPEQDEYDRKSQLMRLSVVHELHHQAELMQEYLRSRLSSQDFDSHLAENTVKTSKTQIDKLLPFFDHARRMASEEYEYAYGSLPNIFNDQVVSAIDLHAEATYSPQIQFIKKQLGINALRASQKVQ